MFSLHKNSKIALNKIVLIKFWYKRKFKEYFKIDNIFYRKVRYILTYSSKLTYKFGVSLAQISFLK